MSALADLGWLILESETSGYGAVLAKTLEAAEPVTAKRWLSVDERPALRRATADLSALEAEAAPQQSETDDDD